MTPGVPGDLPRTDHLPATIARLPEALLRFGRRLFGSVWDVHVHGAEHVPSEGPVIIAANHIATLDGPLAVLWTPRNPAFALAKIELFVGPLKPILSRSGQIPVERTVLVDRPAIDRCLQVLRDGNALVVFPEGKRHGGDFRWIRPGAAYFAIVTGAPVVPLAILGTRRPGQHARAFAPPRSRIDLVFGEPIPMTAQPWPRRRAQVRATAEELRTRLAAHVRQAEALTGMALPGEPFD